jgi:cytochrome o ubiquinol oxidase subunit III
MTALALVAMNPGGDEDVYEEKAFGFWIYLMSDAIIFALLFATYVVMAPNSASGPTGKTLFSLPRTFAETMLLLTSSSTFGLATLAMRSGDRPRVLAWLAITVALGAGFIALELSEFAGMIGQGAGPQRSGFLSAFFTLVGTRGGGGQRGSRGLWLSEARIKTTSCKPLRPGCRSSPPTGDTK